MNYDKYQTAVPTEISYTVDRAMPYGDMPNQMLMAKFEETNDLYDGEGQYDSYVRDEIIDHTPDAPAYESEETRRDYTASSGVLNTRYYGGRGKENSPAHPEMFLSETSRDPRGTATDPNMELMRKQAEKRVAKYTRWSADADHSISQGRWSESEAFNKARVQTHRQNRRRIKVFSTEKDGRREGLRRPYYPRKSVVAATEEDSSLFRPGSNEFIDYVTDQALNPQKKTAALSDTILTNSRLYHNNTPDHEFAVARYGEDARRQKLTSGVESAVTQVETERYHDIPGGEKIELDKQVAYKAAGVVLGAIVTSVEHDQLYGAEPETQTKAKMAAAAKDLTAAAKQTEVTGDFGSSDVSVAAKSRAPTKSLHGAVATQTTHTAPAHQLFNAELMYKAVTTGDVSKAKRMAITDGKTAETFDAAATRKAATATGSSRVNADQSVVEINGKHMTTAVYKRRDGRVSTDGRDHVARTTEHFASESDAGQMRRRKVRPADSTTTNDVEFTGNFGLNDEQRHREVSRGHDRTSVRRRAQTEDTAAEF
jgi:hypothetical protein